MPLYRVDLQRLSRVRLREARALLKSGLYDGAYHISGFSIECALKACIARNVAQYEFPNKKLAELAWTHDLTKLVNAAGLSAQLAAARAAVPFDTNWSIVTKWNPEVRYEFRNSRTDAEGLIKAIGANKHGVLQWIRKFW